MKKTNEKKYSNSLSTSEKRSYYVLMLPFLLFFFLFTILPVLTSVVLSFFTYDMISLPRFAGFDNYVRMVVGDEVFSKSIVNTLKFSVIIGPLSFMLSFLLAWFINEFSPFFRRILAFLYYVPSLIGNAYFIWQVAFSSDSYGYANSLLLSAGIITEPISWFSNTAYNMTIIIIIQLWLGMGVGFLANIAGFQNVNPELYEAGALDGIKSRWHELWYITLPGMKSMLLFSMVMQIQSTFSIGEGIKALAGYPSVNNSVDTLVSHLTDVGTVRYEMGYAAALSVILFSMMLIARYLIGKILNLIGK